MVNIGHYQEKGLAIFWPCKQTLHAQDPHEVKICRAHPLTKPQPNLQETARHSVVHKKPSSLEPVPLCPVPGTSGYS